jgi:hypothetical protein
MVGLPKGILYGLAKVLAPLSFWMAAGWFLFPFMYIRMMELTYETIDVAEVWLFSSIFASLCFVAGLVLLIIVLMGKKPNEAELERQYQLTFPCPYCGCELHQDANSCVRCGKMIPR